ncbi:MAG: beta-agarase [Bacteroidota bacterium]
MKKYLFSHLSAMIIVLFVATTCSTNQQQGTFTVNDIWENEKQYTLLDFEEQELSEELQKVDTKINLTSGQGVTKGKQALELVFKGDEKNPGLEYILEKPFDASEFKNYSLVFDATNLTQTYSIQLQVTVFNEAGENVRRSAVIPVGATQTCFFELAGKYLEIDTGLRDEPSPWKTDAVKMIIRGLKNAVDFSSIAAVHFKIHHPYADKKLVLDNIRIVENPEINDEFLVDIIDKYGQSAQNKFEGKITSDEELKKLADQELQQLTEEGTMSGRSRFGGWAEGPQLEATGFFRTEKVDGKWALVDPDGYLFFSNGIANVRMANTTTFTGMDFKNDTVRYRDPEDVTPEDSRGIVALSEEVTSTAYVAYPERNKMFMGLPTYDDPLANNYSYRREQHIGPFAHGETYSHYQANLERRYGEPTSDAHREKWVDVTLDRFLNWGFTSFGNWAAYEFYHKNRMPYFANGWIIGEFKTVRSGFDYWGPMPDVFDPEFERRAKVTVGVVAEEVKGNPWCIGVFIDNEKSWGRPGSTSTQYGIVLHGLNLKVSESPLKAEFVRALKSKYGSITALNTAWKTDIESWSVFENGVDYINKMTYSVEMEEDLSNLLESYATKYFQVVHDALEEVLPNHLYLGCRFASWGMSEEVRNAAIKYVDVFSYNYYEEAIGTKYWKFLEDIDRPSIIGEFHMGTLASGLFNPGVVYAADHEDRARMYKKYMETVIDNPYFVGAHWFQYIDSPTSGRAHDGENYNVGFVSITDVPYPSMVKAAKTINSSLYSRRFGELGKEN